MVQWVHGIGAGWKPEPAAGTLRTGGAKKTGIFGGVVIACAARVARASRPPVSDAMGVPPMLLQSLTSLPVTSVLCAASG
jgi:hypothetical protein